MPFNRIGKGLKDESGAVAPIYALALTGLVAMAGIGYDVGQVLTMDSELQAAADQAALAAVTQLDRQAGAIDRAKSAAKDLIANNTLLAEDVGQVVIDDAGFEFYATRADAEAGTSPVNDNARARFVKVSIVPRNARYALTPIGSAVASWRSPDIGASAVAGIGSAICKVPPVKICSPTTDPNFDNDYVGKGLLLDSTGSDGLTLQFLGYAKNSPDVINALAREIPTGDCLDEEELVGADQSNQAVSDGLNTRFDIYGGNGQSAGTCSGGINCRPAQSTSKDIIIDYKPAANKSCSLTYGQNANNGEWLWPQDVAYGIEGFKADLTPTDPSLIKVMGHPRDKCHAALGVSGCGTKGVGDGNWDIATYFQVNHPGVNWQTAGINIPAGKTIPRRYDVYTWEIANATGATRSVSYKSKTYSWTRNPICSASPAPSSLGIDRRTFPIAVSNCSAADPDRVVKWVNVFFVEPSLNRGQNAPASSSGGGSSSGGKGGGSSGGSGGANKNYYNTKGSEVYVEVILIAQPGNGEGGNANTIRRDKPYLIK